MATEDAGLDVTLEAGSDLSASQYVFVKVASDKQFDPAGDDVDADGILQDKPNAAGVAGLVRIAGISKCLAGATITAGDDVACGANGKAKKADTGSPVHGRALEAATNGSVFRLLMKKNSKTS